MSERWPMRMHVKGVCMHCVFRAPRLGYLLVVSVTCHFVLTQTFSMGRVRLEAYPCLVN